MQSRRVDLDGWDFPMTLRLALLNADRLPDGGQVRVEVKERGLDIGRLEGIGWTLADPTRHVSGRHCEIRCCSLRAATGFATSRPTARS